MTGRWPVADLRAALDALVPGFVVEVAPELDSTNAELMRRARAGRAEPTLLVAERQTAGRGRLGRPWLSGTGEGQDGPQASLTFSIGLPLAPGDWSGLSLAVGVSVAETLDPDGSRLRLKWPNDVWTVQDRKLGGILIETALRQPPDAQRYLVIGVGLNIGPRGAEGLGTPPAWLREFQPGASAPQVLAEMAPPLVRSVLGFAEHGFPAFAGCFAARDALRGRDVLLSDGTPGRCEGVGPRGELQLRTTAGLASITSSEVSVRPAEGVPS